MIVRLGAVWEIIVHPRNCEGAQQLLGTPSRARLQPGYSTGVLCSCITSAGEANILVDLETVTISCDCCDLNQILEIHENRTRYLTRDRQLVEVGYDLPMWQLSVVSGKIFVIYFQRVSQGSRSRTSLAAD